MAAEDPVHPAGVRDLGGVGREDGEVLRRVRAAQEAAHECGEVSLVCDIKFSMTRIHLLDRMEYGKHWRQRLSVTIICGRVMVVTAAAARERGRGGNGNLYRLH